MSFAKILEQLDIGQSVALPDDWNKVSPSHLERHLGTLHTRPTRLLEGRRFSAARITVIPRAVGQDIPTLAPFLLVTRLK